jgi:hypothetical protein
MDALLRASSLLNSGPSERPVYLMGMAPLLLPFQLLLMCQVLLCIPRDCARF